MSALEVAYVTAGGAGMFCGSCLRDNALVREVRKLGCEALLIPTFTPIRTDDENVSERRLFLGGINLVLGHRWPLVNRLPRPVRRLLDSPVLLRSLSGIATRREGEDDGRLAVSLLRGEHGPHRAEIDDLVDWLASTLQPDLVNLTNLLIAGFVPSLKRRHDVPVLVTLQGDDIFLDALPIAWREPVLNGLREVARAIDGFIVFSRYYRDFMAELLEIPAGRFHVVPLGLADPHEFAPPEPRARADDPVLGYFARLCPEKGFHQLVDAYLLLRAMPGLERTRLHAGGWLGRADRAYFEQQARRIADAGAGADFEHVSPADREAKIRFLHGLDVMAVPTVYREPKGIYVLEALAAGVPVVVPRHGAFPELLETTGGGRLVPPGDANALAASLAGLLRNDAERERLGERGRRRVARECSAATAASRTLEVWHDHARRR